MKKIILGFLSCLLCLNNIAQKATPCPSEDCSLGFSPIFDTSIDGEVDFSKAGYKGLFFNNVYFDSLANFSENTFINLVKMTETEFNGEANFSNDNFQNNVIFTGVNFHQSVNFDNCTFSKYASFSDLTFSDKGSVTFNHTHLPDYLVFDYNSNLPEIDLTDAAFNKGHTIHISLFKSDIAKLHLDYQHFKLFWINYANSDTFSKEDKETVYEALLKNFKDRGQTESYKILDIEYNDFKWKNKGPLLAWLGIFPKLWWQYGYNKERVFVWAFALVILFTLITFKYLNYLNTKVYRINNVPPLPPMVSRKEYKKWHRTDFKIRERWSKIYKNEPKRASWNLVRTRFWYSFIYTSAIFFRLTLNIDKLQFSERKAVRYLIIVYSIGLITLAYMANYILQK